MKMLMLFAVTDLNIDMNQLHNQMLTLECSWLIKDLHILSYLLQADIVICHKITD